MHLIRATSSCDDDSDKTDSAAEAPAPPNPAVEDAHCDVCHTLKQSTVGVLDLERTEPLARSAEEGGGGEEGQGEEQEEQGRESVWERAE